MASCTLPSFLEEASGTTAELVETPAGRAVRLRETHGPSGSGKYVTQRLWLIFPKTCRTVALQMECAGGNPDCSAMFIHRPGQPPTNPERELLLSWLGGARLDPKKPEHQSASAPALAPLPSMPEEDFDEEPPARTRGAKTLPASFSVRAVTQPPPRWSRGLPVAQSLSWADSDIFAEEEDASSSAPRGFVTSGRFHSVHRGDCCIREDAVREVGAQRLRFFSSPSRPIQKMTYVVLEQPKRHRSAWLAASGSGLKLLGMHRGRAWLNVPVFMDPGFSLLAVDLESGAAWHLGLERTDTFDPDAYLPREVTREGLLLEPVDGEEAGPRKTVPWALLERALRDARPPAK
ncbi:hypothetical protein G4177_24740 [Corallococcus sp. ZKHCc1 1396]|uniref:Uncharacterized protein n=1 Tax=Corallococcus soli TaxID=2710757 RepID=A0ABR9PUD9_9BACT|nr:hypothetical protein [Corallococcus soli]MBE4751387.1 hypothetical protein [Corallococcus soli]